MVLGDHEDGYLGTNSVRVSWAVTRFIDRQGRRKMKNCRLWGLLEGWRQQVRMAGEKIGMRDRMMAELKTRIGI